MLKAKKNLFKAVQSNLVSAFPKLKKLEDSPDLKNLKLIDLKIGTSCLDVMAQYTAVASNEIYPDIESKLIEKKVIEEGDVKPVASMIQENQNYRNLRTIWHSQKMSVQVALKVFKPGYEGGDK